MFVAYHRASLPFTEDSTWRSRAIARACATLSRRLTISTARSIVGGQSECRRGDQRRASCRRAAAGCRGTVRQRHRGWTANPSIPSDCTHARYGPRGWAAVGGGGSARWLDDERNECRAHLRPTTGPADPSAVTHQAAPFPESRHARELLCRFYMRECPRTAALLQEESLVSDKDERQG